MYKQFYNKNDKTFVLSCLKQLQKHTNNLFKQKILQLRQPHYNLAIKKKHT